MAAPTYQDAHKVASKKRIPNADEQAFIEDARRIREGRLSDASELTSTGKLREYAEELALAFKDDGEDSFWKLYDTFIVDHPRMEEWKTIIETAAAPDEKATKKKTLINFAELRNRPRPQWVIEGYIYENTIIELYAEAGCYKSFLAFDWSARIATGTYWLGKIKTYKQGVVIYIAAEGADGYVARGDAWCEHNNIPFETLAKNLFFWPESLPLTNSAEVGAFIEEVTTTLQGLDQKPQLVVIDTLLRCSNGENINRQN
jgi:RecA-family ATPase